MNGRIGEKTLALGRFAAIVGAAAALLAACGRSQLPIALHGSMPQRYAFHPFHARGNPMNGSVIYSVLYSFGASYNDGAQPVAGLITDKSGAFYGTTPAGGVAPHLKCVYFSSGYNDGCGTVFKLTPSESGYTETVLYRFCSERRCSDGKKPYSSLASDENAALYGTTFYGGAHDKGTVFKLTPSGTAYTESVLHSFGGSGDGAEPTGSVTLGENGVLYGTTTAGGAYGQGTVFELVLSGSRYEERVVHSFGGSGDGADPTAGVTLTGTGTLYGTTADGGAGSCSYGCGTVFLIKPTGEEKILYGFKGMGSGDGANPSGGVIFEKHGALYGTTEFGGLHGYGTVFSLTPSRSGYAEHVLYGFGATSNNGAYPTAGVVVGKDGALYGTTSSGGVNNCGRHVRAGCGTIFELSRSGSGYSERVLHYFGGGYEGGLPYGGVIFGLNGVLYGTTETGGASRAGTVFSIKP